MAEEQNPASADTPLPTVTGETILQVAEWLSEGAATKIHELVDALQPVDIAGLIELSAPDDRRMLIGILGDAITPEVISLLAWEVREELLERLKPTEIAAAVAELESDDVVDIVEDLDEDERKAVLEQLPAEERQQVEEALTFPEESAGRLMQREVVAVPEDWTVGKTLDHIHEQSEDLPIHFYEVIVIDPWRKVTGSVPLNRILRESRAVKIAEIMNVDINHIPVTTDQEEVAYLFKRYRLQSAPVVDAEDRLLGVITFDDVVDVMAEEAEEDILRMGGLGKEESIHDEVFEVIKSRFRWLLINLFTAIAAAYTISLFEGSLQKVVVLAVLMPIVASMGGNAGTQTMTLAVRALATKELSSANYWRFIGRAIAVGAANGLSFAILIGAVVWLWFGSAQIGFVIGCAMLMNLTMAGLAGAAIPIGLRKLGVDPAIASAVFLTTVTDIVGFTAFLGLATLVLF